MASPNITLKLLVDKKAQKVLFAEATKEFVDFLFHIFSLPLGTLIELLGSNQMVGCLGKLKQSVENFTQDYLQPGITKSYIFNPKTAFDRNTFLLLNYAFVLDKPVTSETLYRCSISPPAIQYLSSSSDGRYGASCYRKYVSERQDVGCPECRRPMNVPLTLFRPLDNHKAAAKNAEGKTVELIRGYVKEVVTYMVMDNLEVKPMSTISSITLINTFGVKDLSQLEEKTLFFGKNEALKLVKASLMTDQVLTTLYLQNLQT